MSNEPIGIRAAFLQVANFEPNGDQISSFRMGFHGVRLKSHIAGNQILTTKSDVTDFLLQAIANGADLPFPRIES